MGFSVYTMGPSFELYIFLSYSIARSFGSVIRKMKTGAAKSAAPPIRLFPEAAAPGNDAPFYLKILARKPARAAIS
jgi:hypothetical protein